MKELTLIIPFLNEGIEVYNTVKNFKETADIEIDIILINDASNDGFDYKKVAEEFQTKYIEHTERTGVAASREEGIKISETEYFLLLDAHMRAFQPNWASLLTNLLNKNQRSILNCCTYSLNSDGTINQEILTEEHKGLGAYIDFSTLDVDWLGADPAKNEELTYDIPCILGASYACNKTYWNKLNGLAGLKYYGVDEQLISIKAYLEGGNCIAVRKIAFGHIFRESVKDVPYKTESLYFTLNKLFVAELLFTPELKIVFMKNMRKHLGSSHITEVVDELIKDRKSINTQKEYLETIFSTPFERIIEKNNYYKDLIKKHLFN